MSVTNPKTGVEKDVVVRTHPNNLKDILIGCGVILAGVAYMTVTAFKNGSKAYMDAEDKALDEAGLLVRGPGNVPCGEAGCVTTDKTKK